LTLINKENKIEKVRIIGPERKSTQVEISITDCYKLKITPVIRISGDIKGTPGIVIQGPKGKIQIKEGVIVAKRHLHISDEQNKKLKLKHNQLVSIKVKGERGLIFENVVVRLGEGNELSFQLDTDEANSAGINGKSEGEII
jgi:putative phosphotransacetylase